MLPEGQKKEEEEYIEKKLTFSGHRFPLPSLRDRFCISWDRQKDGLCRYVPAGVDRVEHLYHI